MPRGETSERERKQEVEKEQIFSSKLLMVYFKKLKILNGYMLK